MQEGSELSESEIHACRILITCGRVKGDGKMRVEMSYEGDAALASYLLEQAQTYINQSDEIDFC